MSTLPYWIQKRQRNTNYLLPIIGFSFRLNQVPPQEFPTMPLCHRVTARKCGGNCWRCKGAEDQRRPCMRVGWRIGNGSGAEVIWSPLRAIKGMWNRPTDVHGLGKSFDVHQKTLRIKEKYVKKTPAEPQPKSKEKHWFYRISAKMTKTNKTKQYATSMKTQNTKKLLTTDVVLVFRLKTKLQRRSWNAWTPTHRNYFLLKNVYKCCCCF